MALPIALTALQKGIVVLAFTGLAAPLIGLLLKRVGGGWETMGGGPFAILNDPPRRSGGASEPPQAVRQELPLHKNRESGLRLDAQFLTSITHDFCTTDEREIEATCVATA